MATEFCTSATQGTIVGVSHPVLYFTGHLPDKTTQLQSTCPANCIHVSAKVAEVSGDVDSRFAMAVQMKGNATYLVKCGEWATKAGTVMANYEK